MELLESQAVLRRQMIYPAELQTRTEAVLILKHPAYSTRSKILLKCILLALAVPNGFGGGVQSSSTASMLADPAPSLNTSDTVSRFIVRILQQNRHFTFSQSLKANELAKGTSCATTGAAKERHNRRIEEASTA
jgi:hypothetical protein